MKPSIRTVFILTTLVIVYSCSQKQKLFVDYSNSQIEYSGRIDTTKVKGAELYWSGSTIKLNFEGKSISVLMEDEKGDNYYNVIIDDNDPIIFRPDTLKQYHQLASKLSEGKHTIEIFKRNEWGNGKTTFYGFQIEQNAKVLPKSLPLMRNIEFYGNSITAGYAIEDFSEKDSPDSTYTNNYLSYAAFTSRHFNAKYQCICVSGTGITVSWHPLIMPEMYDRLIPDDSTSKWDFSLYTPDIVVINLLQNDSWLVNLPDNDEFKKRFGDTKPDEIYIVNAYQQFVAEIRSRYPNAHIICSLGCMDAAKEGSKWKDYIKTAVENLKDNKIYTHFMPYIEATAHPSIEDNKVMAKSLIKFIEENIDW